MGKEAAKKGGAAGRYYAAKGGENVGCGKRHALFCNHLRMVLFVFGLMGSFFLLDSLMLTVIHHFNLHRRGSLQRRRWIVPQVCLPPFFLFRSNPIRGIDEVI